MSLVNCKKCGNSFYVKPSWLKNGHGKYCSPPCQYLGMRSGKVVTCHICGAGTYKPLRVLERSKSGKYFCSKSCQTKWRNTIFIGPKHANWRHGRQAYRSVLARHNIAKICRFCGTADVRVLAVHHIDRNRLNNKVGNLAWLCHNCHFLVHHYDEERQKFMVPIA